MPVYAFNGTNPLTVGQATKASHYTRLFDNIMALKQGDQTFDKLGVTGLVSVTAFGSHSFDAGGTGTQRLGVRNSAAGTGNSALLTIGNDISGGALEVRVTSSTYTPAGNVPQDGTILDAQRPGGLAIAASNVAGAMRFYTGGANERMAIDNTGIVTLTTPAGSGAWNFTSTHADGAFLRIFRSATEIAQLGTAKAVNVGTLGASNFVVYAGAMLELEAATEVRSAKVWSTGMTGISGSAKFMVIDTDGHIGCDTSSRRYKDDIQPLSLEMARAAVLGLQATTFVRKGNWRDRSIGLIAEDVEAVAPHVVGYDADGRPESIQYPHAWVYMLPVVQDFEARIAALEAR